MIKSFLALGCTVSFLYSNFSYADNIFWLDRKDKNLPSHCQDFSYDNFTTISDVFVYGIHNSKSKGFDYELPILRNEASTLWQKLKGESNSVPNDLQDELDVLETEGADMGFDFKKEGDILETLALIDMRNKYPTTDYVTTGGVSYHRLYLGKYETIGELDLLVVRKSDCAVVALGEAKLGVSQLKHAHDQLKRFINFMKKEVCHDQPKASVCAIS